MAFGANGQGLAGFAQFVNAIAFTGSGGLVAATQQGLFLASDGETFIPWSDTIETERIADVVVSNGVVYLATEGAGVYRRSLP